MACRLFGAKPYLNQYLVIVNWTLWNKLQWMFNQNSNFSFKNMHFKMSSAHYHDIMMSTLASQITSLTIVYSTVYPGADLRKHQSSASLAFLRGIQRWPMSSPHKGPVKRKLFPFDDVIMQNGGHFIQMGDETSIMYIVQRATFTTIFYQWILPTNTKLGTTSGNETFLISLGWKYLNLGRLAVEYCL